MLLQKFPNSNYYNELGLEDFSIIEEIKRAYRKIAFRCHPDKNKDIGSLDKFKKATEAYEILSDVEKKEAYDNYLKTLNTVQTDNRTHKGYDLITYLQISIEDIVYLRTKAVAVKRNGLCPACSGTGSTNRKRKLCPLCKGISKKSYMFSDTTKCPLCNDIGHAPEIPCVQCKGRALKEEIIQEFVHIIPDRSFAVFDGKGHYPVGGGLPGDLIINFSINKNPIYNLKGFDVERILTISPAQAALGDEIDCDFFGRNITVKVPAGSQHGAVLEKDFEGLSYEGQSGKFRTMLKIEIPLILNEIQRGCYQKLLEAE